MPVPYWRLSGFYFCYFAVLGAYIPYWSLYLKSINYTALEIGIVTGATMATRIIAPNIWGWWADTTGHRLRVIRLGSFAAAVFFCGVFVSTELRWLLLVMLVHGFFWNGVLAQFEVVTLQHLGSAHDRYGQIRVWGSIGFIVVATLLGLVFQWLPIAYLPLFLLAILLSIWLFALSVPPLTEQPAHPHSGGVLSVVCQPAMIGFLAVCFLMQLSHGPYYTFFSVYLEQSGYQRGTIGFLWSLGVLAEIGVFMAMHWLIPRIGLRVVVLVSLALGVLRWLLIAYQVDSLFWLLIAQCLHAATFGAFHSAGIEFIRRTFPGQLAGQGQALFNAVSFGVGGAAGALLSGFLWGFDPQLTFILASAACALAVLVAFLTLRGKQL